MFSRLKRFFQSFRAASKSELETLNSGDPEYGRVGASQWWDNIAERPLSLDAQLAVANQRMTEEVVRQRIRENVQRFREANDNPASLWALSFVDPYDWAMDTPDFYPGIGLGGGWGVPWLLNNQGRGDALPVYINEMGLKIIRDWSRRICAFNEFALNAVENRISYIVGKGYQYTVVPKKKPTTPALSIGNEEGHEPSGLAAMAQAVLDEFISRERWNEREQEIVRRCDRDGEAFLRFFHVGAGRTAVRFVEPEHVTQGQGYQAGEKQADDIWRQYGVNVQPGDIEDVESYSIIENPAGHWLANDVPAGDVLHVKVNTDFDSKRGLPTLFPVRKNLERADKLLRNMSVMAQVQATFAVIRKHKQFGPSSVSTYQQNAADMSVNVPVSGRTLSLRQLYPGSIIDTSEKTEYEFPSANVDASGLVAVLQAELRAIAARLVMPEFMLTVDASNANFASTMVAESPFVKYGERQQSFFARHFGDGEYGRGRVQGAMWRVLANAVEGGLLPREVLTELEIQCEGPTLVVRDKAVETKRAETLNSKGILSDTTWAKWEGLDLEQELQLGAAKAPEPAPFGGIPGETPTPAPPGSAEGMSESKDASGHEHDAKGLFTSTGGGGAAKREKASKKKGPPADDPVHSYLDGFNDEAQEPATAKDARQANQELKDEGSKYRIVPGEKGKWEAKTVKELRDEIGEDWVVATNPLTGRPEVGSKDYYEELATLSGDKESRSYLHLFNNPEMGHITHLQVESANRDLEGSGSKFRIVHSPEYGFWIAKPADGSAGQLGEAVLREDEGRWITIGGKKGESGKRHGGSPVFIKNGQIVKGAPSLTGRKIGSMKDEPADQSRRAENSQSKAYERAKYAKQAKKEGIQPKHLHSLADEIAAHDREHVERRKQLLADARKTLTAKGYDARALTTNLRSGRVEDKIPHFDELADEMAKRYPDQFGGHDDAESRLKDLLAEGNPEAMSQADAYEKALEHLRDMKASEPENDPFSFDFGANEKPPKREEPKPAPSRQEARVNAAKARYESRGRHAKGGGLFGGEDMQSREGFRKLPDGAGVLFTSGEFEGKTGKIVHDYDPSTGHPRIVAEVDGRKGLVPITPDAIEPLDAHLSWRTEYAGGPSKQGGLYTADQFLKPRD